jgi:hypothetical protein
MRRPRKILTVTSHPLLLSETDDTTARKLVEVLTQVAVHITGRQSRASRRAGPTYHGHTSVMETVESIADFAILVSTAPLTTLAPVNPLTGTH